MEKLNARSQPHPLGCVVGTGAQRNTETDDIRRKGEKKKITGETSETRSSIDAVPPPTLLTYIR